MSTAKERPQCRKVIERRKLRPFIRNGVWDGLFAVDEGGQRSSMSEGMRAQMRRMVAEGRWGDVKRAGRERRQPY